MAKRKVTRHPEKTAGDLLNLTGSEPGRQQPAGFELTGADRVALTQLAQFVDRVAGSHEDMHLSALGNLGGDAGVALGDWVSDRYLTDDLVGSLDLGFAAEMPISRMWGGQVPGYWKFGDIDTVIVELEEEEPEFAEILAESGDVRRRVRESLFTKRRQGRTAERTARAGKVSPGRAATPAARKTVAAGRPPRASVWDAPQDASLVELTDGAADSASRLSRTPGRPGITQDAYAYPYPRSLGKAGARFVTGANRRLAGMLVPPAQRSETPLSGATAGGTLGRFGAALADARLAHSGSGAGTTQPRGRLSTLRELESQMAAGPGEVSRAAAVSLLASRAPLDPVFLGLQRHDAGAGRLSPRGASALGLGAALSRVQDSSGRRLEASRPHGLPPFEPTLAALAGEETGRTDGSRTAPSARATGTSPQQRTSIAGFVLDGLPVGRAALPALTAALDVAQAAFSPTGEPIAGVIGPAVADRSLGIVRLSSGHPSTEMHRPSAPGALDAAFVELDGAGPATSTPHTATEGLHAQGTYRSSRHVSLFDVVPSQGRSRGRATSTPAGGLSQGGSARQQRNLGERGSAPQAQQLSSPQTRQNVPAGPVFGLELPHAERFASAHVAPEGVAAYSSRWESSRILGAGWTRTTEPSGATARDLAFASASPGELLGATGDARPASAEGQPPATAARRDLGARSHRFEGHGGGQVLLDLATNAADATYTSPLRNPVGTADRLGAMGARIRQILGSLAASPTQAAALLGVLQRSASTGAEPPALRAAQRAGTTVSGRYREAAESVLVDLGREAGLTDLRGPGGSIELEPTETRGGRRSAGRRGRSLTTPAARGSAAHPGAVAVSVRLPSGAVEPVSLRGPIGRGPSEARSFATPPVHVVLPSATPGGAVPALPNLVRSLEARQLRGLAGGLGTDAGQAFALGLPEAVLGSLRTLATQSSDPSTATASYGALLRRATGMEPLRVGEGGPLDAARGAVAAESRFDAMGGPGRPTSLLGLDSIRRLASAGSRADDRHVSSAQGRSPSGGGIDRLGWSVSSAGAGGVALELVDMARAAAGQASAVGQPVAASGRVGLPGLTEGQLVGPSATRTTPAPRAASEPRRIGAPSPSSRAVQLLTPAAAALRSGLAFSDEQIAALAFAERHADRRVSNPVLDRILADAGLAASGGTAAPRSAVFGAADSELDLVALNEPELRQPVARYDAVTETSDGADTGRSAQQILARAAELQAGSPTSARIAATTTSGGSVPGRLASTAGRDYGTDLELLSPEEAAATATSPRTHGAHRFGGGRRAARRTLPLGTAGRSAAAFQPTSTLRASDGVGRTGELSASSPQGPSRGAVSHARSGRAYGLDVSLHSDLVSLMQVSEGPARLDERDMARVSSDRGGFGRSSVGRDRVARQGGQGEHPGSAAGGAATGRRSLRVAGRLADGSPSFEVVRGAPAHRRGASGRGAASTEITSLLRRLSNGGSASPVQREIASLIDSLPTNTATRAGALGVGPEFSRDLLVRLEAAIDTMAGRSGPGDIATGLRTGDNRGALRVSDLGADSLMSFVSPVLGADPFDARTTGATAAHRSVAGRDVSGSASLGFGVSPAGTASQPASAQALDGLDWNLVTPHAAARDAGRTAPDLSRLAQTALSSGGVSRSDLPLIAPVAMAVATHAQLTTHDDRKPESTAPAAAGKHDSSKAIEAKVDLDKLAVEMANRISIRSRLELERRGIWHSSKI